MHELNIFYSYLYSLLIYYFFFKGFHPCGMLLKYIVSKLHIFHILSGVQALQTTELQQFKCLDVLPRSSES